MSKIPGGKHDYSLHIKKNMIVKMKVNVMSK